MNSKGFLMVLVTGLLALPFMSEGADEITELTFLAKQGDVMAQSDLGIRYYNGDGVDQNYFIAEKWLRLAASQGNAAAQSLLGIFYYEGTSILQDFEEAESWVRLAAEQGDLKAQRFLGLCYFEGAGVPEDVVQAYAWFNIAAAQGDKEAVTLRKNCRRKMSTSQELKGQRLSRKYADKFLKLSNL